jgi:hypothetical protein
MTKPLEDVKGYSLSGSRSHAKYKLIRRGLLNEDERYPLAEAIKRAGL